MMIIVMVMEEEAEEHMRCKGSLRGGQAGRHSDKAENNAGCGGTGEKRVQESTTTATANDGGGVRMRLPRAAQASWQTGNKHGAGAKNKAGCGTVGERGAH